MSCCWKFDAAGGPTRWPPELRALDRAVGPGGAGWGGADLPPPHQILEVIQENTSSFKSLQIFGPSYGPNLARPDAVPDFTDVWRQSLLSSGDFSQAFSSFLLKYSPRSFEV